ncbi:unnamed protein product [Pieris macdunnoughi]|uniref:Enoyl reductase (ER) domain-containing protein n=1 Tax=Pieris macdunnoughi TaxID=345717 RepID=A0A821SYV8_9NEOP|nr:unnamed protein product [Pieris macdunnoughi]
MSGVGARMAAWRAHAYGGVGELRLESARVPPLRSADDLLVRVTAASLNPIDLAMLDGYGSRILNTLRRLEGADVEFPLVPGRDFSGVVVRAGRGARLQPGTRVWGVLPPHRPGALAEYVALPSRWAGPAPVALDPLAAAGALYAGLTAASALRIAGLAGASAPGARVLLLGLGGVGAAALQLLVRGGARVAVSCAPEQAAEALALGAVAALHRGEPDYEARVAASGPFDAVLDCGGVGGWAAAEAASRWGFSRYVTLTTPLLSECDSRGLLAGSVTALGALSAQTFGAMRGALARNREGPCPPHVRWAFFVPNASDIEMLRRLADRGQFRVSVQRVFGWRDAPAAFAALAEGHARGKLLLDFSN